MFAYYATQVDILDEPRRVSMHATTPVEDSLIVDQVYQSCVVSILQYDTRTNMIL